MGIPVLKQKAMSIESMWCYLKIMLIPKHI